MVLDNKSPFADEIRNSSFDLDDLPETILQELVEYLNLEYAAPEVSEPVSVEDLSFAGEFEMYDKPIRYWRYPCSEENGCFVTVQPFADSYCIGMEFKLPGKNRD